MKASSSVNNPYLIADKPGQVISMTAPTTGIPFTYSYYVVIFNKTYLIISVSFTWMILHKMLGMQIHTQTQ